MHNSVTLCCTQTKYFDAEKKTDKVTSPSVDNR